MEVMVRRDLRSARTVRQARHREGDRRILGIGLRHGRGISDDGAAESYDNRTLYGAAKAFNEGLLRTFNDMHGLDYVAFRYFNVYGDRMDIHGRYTEVLIRWMERLEAGLPPIIFGDGQQTMDFIHVRDVARANILGAKSSVTDEVFNVASGTETSLVQLAAALASVMGRRGLTPEFAPERTINPVPRRLASTAKAEELLGFRSTIPLEQGLNQLVKWWRSELSSPATPRQKEAAVS